MPDDDRLPCTFDLTKGQLSDHTGNHNAAFRIAFAFTVLSALAVLSAARRGGANWKRHTMLRYQVW